jgi:O-methyltransferase involved in polyketide biosynthesis
MYDYYLGGKDNYPADRAAAEQVIAMMPPGTIRTAALQNRRFLGRAVRYLVTEAGIRQFLDIGTGLPTRESVHEVANSIAPECRVVYVDHDPVVLSHGRDLLNGIDRATIIKHDLRWPEEILADAELSRTLDLGRPVAVLLVAVLHFLRDLDDPRGIIRRLMEAVPPGSYLVISHATADSYPEFDAAIRVYGGANVSMHSRSRAGVEALFAGFDLVDPGIAWLPQWHPDAATGLRDDPGRSLCWCGVARKRA